MIIARFNLVVALALTFAGIVIAQDAVEDSTPLLTLEPEEDGTVWVTLDLPSEPESPEGVSSALGVLMGESDDDYIAEYYDGGYDDGSPSWSGYWYDIMSLGAFRNAGTLNLDAIRPILRELGYDHLDVTVFDAPRWKNTLHWGGQTLEGGVEPGYTWAMLSLERPLPPLHLDCRRTPLSIAVHYSPIPLLCLVLGRFGIWLRRRARQWPEREAGYAAYRCTQGYRYGLAVFCVLLVSCIGLWNPIAPLAAESVWVYEHLYGLSVGLWLLLATAAAIIFWVYLLPVYLRLPGATWTRRDFAAQALWNSAFLGTAVLGAANISNVLDKGVLHFTGFLLVLSGFGFYFHIRRQRAHGFVLQVLDEGALRERVETMAANAGANQIAGVYLLYLAKSPILYALAATNRRVAFTAELLQSLSCRETDGVIAHELTHLVKNHPIMLYRMRILCVVLGLCGGITIGAVLFLPLTVFLPQFVDHVWALLVAVGLSLGILMATLMFLSTCRRFEYQADAGAVAMTGDPEAVIASLVKTTRLNHMPLEWGGTWSERLITHPSTRRRAERIAQRNNVPPDRLQALLDGASVGEGHYAIPSSASLDRIFTTQHKSAIQWSNLLYFMFSAALAPVSIVWVAAKFPELPLTVPLLMPFMVAGSVGCLLTFQNYAPLRGFRDLARHFRAKHRHQRASLPFVTLAPTTSPVLYEGFSNWDVGLLALGRDGLHYLGDAVSFTLPREAVQEIALVSSKTILLTQVRVRVCYRVTDAVPEPQSIVFGAGEARSLLSSRRQARVLLQRLQAWHGAPETAVDSDPPGAPYPPPQNYTARSQPFSEVFRLPQMLIFFLLATFAAYALGAGAGLPDTSPFEHSLVFVGQASGLGALLAYAPAWWRSRKRPIAEKISVDDAR